MKFLPVLRHDWKWIYKFCKKKDFSKFRNVIFYEPLFHLMIQEYQSIAFSCWFSHGFAEYLGVDLWACNSFEGNVRLRRFIHHAIIYLFVCSRNITCSYLNVEIFENSCCLMHLTMTLGRLQWVIDYGTCSQVSNTWHWYILLGVTEEAL